MKAVTLSLLINVAVVNVLSSYQEGMNSARCENFPVTWKKGKRKFPGGGLGSLSYLSVCFLSNNILYLVFKFLKYCGIN